MLYTLILNYPEPADGELDDETLKAGMAAFDAYAKDLDSAGAFVSANVLQPSMTATTVTLREGSLQIQDGPFADTKDKLAGTFVIDVDDLDSALAWAGKCPAAQWGVVEVRPTALVFSDGAWHPAE